VTQCVDLDNDVVVVRTGSCSLDSFQCKDPAALGKPARKMDCNGTIIMAPSSMSYLLFAMENPTATEDNGTSTQFIQTAENRLINYADTGATGTGSKGDGCNGALQHASC
jgi:hypothetical protein